ncbi:hypothetical protein C4D60_Mb08t26810 [Musa balbisiana]|uniref:Uncharacterized protein n=1 Tax=Musa balbisiana TaxID=52838 RepID=A0A4S8K6R5_MUSBA|nr:hypothetical protein C4D60_Mb08t26810 [Musa balbisiana]
MDVCMYLCNRTLRRSSVKLEPPPAAAALLRQRQRQRQLVKMPLARFDGTETPNEPHLSGPTGKMLFWEDN